MNIYAIKYKSKLKEHEFLTSIIHFTEEEATACARDRCEVWGDDWTFEIILSQEPQ